MSEFSRAFGDATTPLTQIRVSTVNALRDLLGVPIDVSEQSLIGAAKALVAVHAERTYFVGQLLNILGQCDNTAGHGDLSEVVLKAVPPDYEERAFARMQRMPHGQKLELVPGKNDTVTIDADTAFVNVDRGGRAFGLDVSIAVNALRHALEGDAS